MAHRRFSQKTNKLICWGFFWFFTLHGKKIQIHSFIFWRIYGAQILQFYLIWNWCCSKNTYLTSILLCYRSISISKISYKLHWKSLCNFIHKMLFCSIVLTYLTLDINLAFEPQYAHLGQEALLYSLTSVKPNYSKKQSSSFSFFLT